VRRVSSIFATWRRPTLNLSYSHNPDTESCEVETLCYFPEQTIPRPKMLRLLLALALLAGTNVSALRPTDIVVFGASYCATSNPRAANPALTRGPYYKDGRWTNGPTFSE
jgi:hypothetical protein